MRWIFSLIGILSFLQSNACECSERPLILDLYSADIVFIGTAIEKTYSDDSSEYTIIFKASKFYKNNKPEQDLLRFTKISEGKYSNQYSSCDYHLNAGNEWLIIANYRGDEISFGYCSESRVIDRKPLTQETTELLENIQNFDISEHRFSSGDGFTSTKPMMNLDSLANSVGTREFEKQTQLIVFDFDRQGNLTTANFYPRRERTMTEPNFGLSWFENIEYAKPKNEFEELAIELARKITKWTPIKHHSTSEPVLGRASAFFSISEQGNIEIEY
jgi:hypothetical protein